MDRLSRLSRYAAVVALALATSGCLFENLQGLGNLDPSGSRTNVQLTARAVPYSCSHHDQDGVECEYFFSGYSETPSIFTLLVAFSELFGLVDPVILQVPADATDFAGTYRNSQGSAALTITEAPVPLRIDSDRTYTVEAGKKLVVVDFPPAHALIPGDTYFFTLAFTVPRPIDRLEVKALFAGRVALEGVSYYPPLAPCESDFARVPTLVIGLAAAPAPISVNPLRTQRGCNRTAYRFAHEPPPGAVNVIEYYNASLDHYFVTWLPGEIAALDAGTTIRGWRRTGYTFTAWPSAQPGTSPVCRFYLPPAFGDSHFYGRGSAECDQTAQRYPDFALEATEFMHLALPVNGACPAGTFAVYRVFSNRGDANHRYTTNSRVRDYMATRRWLPEGDGADRVVMCAP